MNRRSFITSMLAAAVAPMVLKGAGRTWTKVESLLVPKHSIINPDYINAPYEVTFYWDKNATIVPFMRGPEERFTSRPIMPSEFREITESWPMRFDKNRNPVSPFIEV